MNKYEHLIGLLEGISKANKSVDCQLISSFDKIDCLYIQISYLDQSLMNLIVKYGFSLVNIGTIPTKQTLFVTLRWGSEAV